MNPSFTEYEPVVEIHNAGDRVFLRSVMDAAGFTFFIQGEHVAPYLFNAMPMRLMVRQDQADDAREIIKAIDIAQGDSDLKPPEGDETHT